MAKKNTRLELTWIGKENRPKLEPRILIENPEKSYHAEHRVNENDIFDNRLILGDNLLALKALEQEFAGKVKCIYIDPPYNTGNAFEHYDDGIEHSLWLSLMRDRLELLRSLLSDNGSIWISIDDDESHYLKVLCDEVFGRMNFVANVIWEKKYSPQNDAKWLSDSHDHILVYAKKKDIWRPNLLPRTIEMDKRYKNPDSDPRGAWKSSGLDVKTYSAVYDYPISTPSGRVVNPPAGACWRMSKERLQEMIKDNRIWFGTDGSNVPSIKRFLSEVKQGLVSKTIWVRGEVGDNQEAKKEVKEFNSDDVFTTPKPERLIQRILVLATNPGDIVLDSFLGSGTTAAVAHKMGRRWVAIELGEHCHTHCIPRLKKVIDGEDSGGITKAVNWKGGGGFRYYRLGPSLIVEDEWGNAVINSEFNAAMLAEAMCKLEGFEYAPSEDVYWIHGKSTETDFLYVTTQFMSRDMLVRLSDEVGPERSLLICCSAFRCNPDRFPNLTIKKIPKAVLKKCEWGHDDYSLEVENLPVWNDEGGMMNDEEEMPVKPRRKFGKGKADQTALFDMEGDQ
ncbi:MAG: site-specific DNA-methyltransferase [bacterium]|nr:MAG: site-specific DNA-methyltransferase [bacterium]